MAEKDARVDALPTWAKRLHDIMDAMPHGCGGGIGSVCVPWPSPSRKAAGNDNYLVVIGDGMFMFAFEVLDADPAPMPNFLFVKSWLWNRDDYETEWSKVFRKITGKNYGDFLTYLQLSEGLEKLVAHYQTEWDRRMGPLQSAFRSVLYPSNKEEI
jgi:hypothetical protein